jgi:hypothetical protein
MTPSVEYALHMLNLAEEDLAGRSPNPLIRGRRRIIEAVAVSIEVAKRHLEKTLEAEKSAVLRSDSEYGEVAAARKMLAVMLTLLPDHDAVARSAPLPIDTAPINSGEEFGPCLLWEPDAANYPQEICWMIGSWNGEEWLSQDGDDCHPMHWYPLPAPGPLTDEQKRRIEELTAEGHRNMKEDTQETTAAGGAA